MGLAILLLGAVIIMIPYYIFPVCEYAGLPPMRCSVTAHSESIAGLAIIALGLSLIIIEATIWQLISSILITISGILIVSLPFTFAKTCLSPNMPCNYGTRPALVIGGSLIILLSLIFLILNRIRSKNASIISN